MAERKTTYTNADLVQGGPATIYGKWQTKSRPASMRSLLDEMIDAGETPESVVAGAKRQAQKPSVAGDARRVASDRNSARAQKRAEDESTLLGQLRAHPMEYARNAVMGAAVPLSFAGGPLGAAASVPLSIQALSEFAEDPSLLGGIGVAATAIPQVKWALKAPRNMSEGRKIAEGLYRQTGMSRGAETPYRFQGEMPNMRGASRPPHTQQPDYGYKPGKTAGSWERRTEPPRYSPRVQSIIDNLEASELADAEAAALRGPATSRFARSDIPVTTTRIGADDLAGPSRFDLSESQRQGVDALEALLEQTGGRTASRVAAGTEPVTQVTRVPIGATGDEYTAIRESGGAFNKANRTLDPEEALLEDDFWDEIARRYFGR